MSGIASIRPVASAGRPNAGPARPKICQLVHGLPVGGAEILIDRIIRRLRDRYDFVVACLDDVGQLGEALIDDGVPVVRLGRRPGFDWKCVRRLQRWLRDEGIQIVHAHQCTPFAYALATSVFGRRPPILLTEHGRFFPDAPSRKRKLLHRLLTRKGDHFVAVGETVRRALIENEGLPSTRVQVVYNGVDFQREADVSNERTQVRRELGVGEEHCVVVQVARLNKIKDHTTAVKAMKLAAGRDEDLRLFIVGDGPERAAIEHAIADQSLQQRVTMLGLRSDVRRLLTAADVFLLTSLSEGVPVTVLEAMAAGVPVVATNVGGIPELICHDQSGLLAPAGDAAGLADALVRLAADPALRRRFATTAQQRAATNFCEQAMLDAYDRLYQGMVTHGVH